MTPASGPRDLWGDAEHRPLATVARDVSTRYLAIATDAIIDLLLLPFNVRELGPSAYGLWMLTASLTTYFAILDLGFGGSIVRFVAHHRARRDARGLNEIASTLFGIFSITGCVAYVVFLLLAFNIAYGWCRRAASRCAASPAVERRHHRSRRRLVMCYGGTFLAFAVNRDERQAYMAKAFELARARRRVAAAA